MPGLTFNTKFKKNSGILLNPAELLELYFFGIRLVDSYGNTISESTINQFILSAQEEVEKWLNIKLVKQVIKEDKDFNREDWYQWGYLRTTYPVVKPLTLEGYIGETKQITYPPEWLSARKTSDGETYHRHMFLVPSTNSPVSHMVVYTGITPHLSLTANQMLPNYWRVSYETGFCKIPNDLLNFVGMLSAINVFHIMGDLITGIPGLSSQSISIDGLSQSISAKSDGYGQRIKGYLDLINGPGGQNGMKERLYNYYKGFTFSCF